MSKETIEINDIDELDKFDEFNEFKENQKVEATFPIEETTAEEPKKEKKKKGKKPKKTGFARFRSILLKIFIVFIILGLIFTGMMLFMYSKSYSETIEVTPQNFWVGNSSTTIYDNEGEVITSLTPNATNWVPITDEEGNQMISQQYLDAVVAAEDSKFYEHGGVDLIGMVKATLRTVFTDATTGGSTITMQLGKLIYMPEWLVDDDGDEIYGEPEDQDGLSMKDEHPIDYKLTQMAYARKIEEQFSKEEILECYVNVAYFGNGIYGVANASEYYFGTTPDKLTLEQAATLAGIPQLPENLNPHASPEDSQERRDYVLGRMLELQYITQEEYDAAIKTNVADYTQVEQEAKETSAAKYTAYVDIVYRELIEIFDPEGTGSFNPATAGLEVHTNMDKDLQDNMYDVLNSDTAQIDEYIQYGSVMMDTQTGQVLAVGSGSEEDASYLGTNYAYNYYRQPGSTAKPLLDYAPAVEYLEWSTAHTLVDEPITYSDSDIAIENYDGTYNGEMTMQKALAGSRNTTAVSTFQQVVDTAGIGAIVDFAQGLGLSDVTYETINEAYAIGGWSYGTTAWELTGAYAAFGNGGTYNEPHCIEYITIKESSPYYEEYGPKYEYEYESHKAMEESTAFLMSEMMDMDNPEAATNAGEYDVEGLEMYGKTGTSDWGSEGLQYGIPENTQRDKWIAGYTPDVTCVLWSGYSPEGEAKGYYLPLDGFFQQVYKDIMQGVVEDTDEYLHDDEITQPSNVESHTLNGVEHWFIHGSDDLAQFDGDQPYEVTEPTTATAPNVTATVSADSVGLKWDYSGNYRDTSSWNIYIDGVFYKNTTDTSLSIPATKITEVGGCTANHVIGVELVENTGTVKNKSNMVNTSVTLKDISHCEKPVEPAEPVDSDKDGLTDEQETGTYKTNPQVADTDGDGLSDKDEVGLKTDPLKADTDGDKINDGAEKTAGTNPLDKLDPPAEPVTPEPTPEPTPPTTPVPPTEGTDGSTEESTPVAPAA